MTPADVIEYIIKEIAVNENGKIKSYKITSFPEIYVMKYKLYYTVEIMKKHRQNADVIKRFEELINELETRKILIENKIVDLNRKILFRENWSDIYFNIYYKDCVFTDPLTLIGTNCENCIFEKE